MDQVLEHAAGDLVARVQAGVTIGQLAVALGAAGQQLALDVPAEATVGGVVATGTAGPRRFRYGAPRDLLIGITVVRADGVVAHSGGKVVKNVAGYDLGKLFAGSQGTLGVITEATFRLHPLPAAVAWVTAEFGPAERAGAVAAVAAAAGSPLVPSAVELDWPGGSQRPLRVGVLLEGTGPGVAERAKQMSELLAAPGGAVSVSRDGARALGRAAVVGDGGPGLVLGERAGPGARRAGRGGRRRRGPAGGERPGGRGRAVRLPGPFGPGYLGRRCRPVRDGAAGAGRGAPAPAARGVQGRRGRAGRAAGGARGGRGRDGSRPGPDASRQGPVRSGSPDVPRPYGGTDADAGREHAARGGEGLRALRVLPAGLPDLPAVGRGDGLPAGPDLPGEPDPGRSRALRQGRRALRPLPGLHGLHDRVPLGRAVRPAHRGGPGVDRGGAARSSGRGQAHPGRSGTGPPGPRSSRCSLTRSGCGR